MSSKIPFSAFSALTPTVNLGVPFRSTRARGLAFEMGPVSPEPSASVATGGSDWTDCSGKDPASGTCHVCGGSLRRGNVNLARQCPSCKTRYHASDCGKRRSNAGYTKAYDSCPKVRHKHSTTRRVLRALARDVVEPTLSGLATIAPNAVEVMMKHLCEKQIRIPTRRRRELRRVQELSDARATQSFFLALTLYDTIKN